jgi:hypothetical protein
MRKEVDSDPAEGLRRVGGPAAKSLHGPCGGQDPERREKVAWLIERRLLRSERIKQALLKLYILRKSL